MRYLMAIIRNYPKLFAIAFAPKRMGFGYFRYTMVAVFGFLPYVAKRTQPPKSTSNGYPANGVSVD